ncbi:hypothetical protein AVEN_188445-1 [Araneus ventricosus]|uniref:Uncharacterized protein n=1 Tax=Araneus ventricosus TaxID=182803 RepID=A0A4Y1ZV07_ARAVE|nr:hypothetical protein AVEN_188445-1 [Araneus ventricosus]
MSCRKRKKEKKKICHCALSSKNHILLAKRDSSDMLGACGNNKMSAASVCCNTRDFVQEFLTFQGPSGSIMSHSYSNEIRRVLDHSFVTVSKALPFL